MATRPEPAQQWPRRRLVALGVVLTLVVASLGLSNVVYAQSHLKVGPNDYNLAAWEARNFPVKWTFQLEQLFKGKPSLAEQDADILRFFQLTHDIEGLEAKQSDIAQRGQPADPAVEASLAQDRSERSGLEHQVQATVEGRLTKVAKQQGLTRSFLGLSLVWPPANFEFADSPRILATSPRDHIQLLDTKILRPDLNLTQVEAIEAGTEQKRGVSAIAFPTSGIGAYPPVVEYSDDYDDLLRLVAHEWTHNYLFFAPLGFNYYKSSDLRTINETVADLIGQELAAEMLRQWPLPQPEPATPAPQATTPEPPPQPAVDTGAVLRQLRTDVDALLSQGKIDEAEALMEQRRQELAAQGVNIRKLNQAYFAFVNLYAGEAGQPAATSPIGPKIDELRRRSGSLHQFAEIIGGVTSVGDLDKALSKLPAP